MTRGASRTARGWLARLAPPLLAIAAAAACTTRLTNDERTKIEFWGTVSAEAETGARELDEVGRADLFAALGETEGAGTWQELLDALDDREALEPLAERIRAVVDREIDAGVRVELATPAGNQRLRTLIRSSLESGLASPAERR